MAYTDTKAKCEAIQRVLNAKLDPSPALVIDGRLGRESAAAIIRARSVFGLSHIGEPVIDTDLMRELGLLAIQNPAVVAGGKLVLPQVFNNLTAILAVISALKGKTMTTDQITGILRLILGLVAGYFVTKGIGTQSLWDWISAGVLTAIPAVWSWYSNRPKTILTIAEKNAAK